MRLWLMLSASHHDRPMTRTGTGVEAAQLVDWSLPTATDVTHPNEGFMIIVEGKISKCGLTKSCRLQSMPRLPLLYRKQVSRQFDL